jgi:hypothetical protein
MTPPALDGGAAPTILEVIRAVGRIEGKLDSFTDLVKSLQTDHNNFDSRLATLELANAAGSRLLERIINVENNAAAVQNNVAAVQQLGIEKRLNNLETTAASMQQRIWMALGAGGTILMVMQFLVPFILAQFK